ncbi:unnamed protein product [Eruca vesicaria subsp. sativa]|uniref:Uncharacterized protein n=1 Tax=Eruca vesicaria subsp. sativa TaxID=29727 RepID=A0ABC8JDG4_ERUVS|nr:unnamed protein product [Eruca vesicaria subsp. sativa]
MNTKTMRLPPRRMLTSDKRILPNVVVTDKPTETAVTNPPQPPPPPSMKSILKKTPTAAESAGSKQLLAGYLAHEYLNKGTFFGEQWNPTRSESESRKSEAMDEIEVSEHKRRRYVEVADILKVDGAFMPGIINPSQLAQSLKL